tara:strand:- start:104 stop:406 length:303 start_codon:yes stop_codon:yes gene_type:complete
MEKVVFRIENNGQICAVFPYLLADKHNVTVWDSIGGHSACSYGYATVNTRPARESEYKHAKKVLENHYGYELQVLQRMPSYASFVKHAKTENGVFMEDVL